MQGAREYASLFCTGQHGRLFLVAGSHARGRIFHIWVLPADTVITGMPWSVRDAVEVYGITGGQPGWTETYGWLHKGPWQEDFAALVAQRRKEIENGLARREQEKAAKDAAERARVNRLLESYAHKAQEESNG